MLWILFFYPIPPSPSHRTIHSSLRCLKTFCTPSLFSTPSSARLTLIILYVSTNRNFLQEVFPDHHQIEICHVSSLSYSTDLYSVIIDASWHIPKFLSLIGYSLSVEDFLVSLYAETWNVYKINQYACKVGILAPVGGKVMTSTFSLSLPKWVFSFHEETKIKWVKRDET